MILFYLPTILYNIRKSKYITNLILAYDITVYA